VSTVTNTLRITTEQVLRFAAASGDRNPLHVDARYARHTPTAGRSPMAHSSRSAPSPVCDPERVRFARRIDLQFRQPVFPGEEYSPSRLDGDLATTRVEVRGGGTVALSMTVATDAAGFVSQVPEQHPVGLPEMPRGRTIEDLARGEAGATHPHACRVPELVALAADLGDRAPAAGPGEPANPCSTTNLGSEIHGNKTPTLRLHAGRTSGGERLSSRGERL
jgi:hypothetical protein